MGSDASHLREAGCQAWSKCLVERCCRLAVMGWVLPKGILLLCLAALAIAACSGDTEEQRSEQPEATARNGADEAAEARTVPKQGVLAPGEYSTGEEFEPPFSFEVGEGWRVLPVSGPDSLRLGYVTPGKGVAEGKALRFLNVREVFEPREEGDRVSFETEPAPDNVSGWLGRHPYLSTGDAEPVDIGGVAGERIDAEVEVPESYREAQGRECPVPCIPIFRLGGDSVTRITEKGKNRIVVLDDVVEDETVVVIVSAPVAGFDEFLPEAREVLDTIEWHGR